MFPVLIIKLGALGDVIMATSLMRQIQKHHGDERVALLTADAWDGLFQCWEGLEVAAFPRAGVGEGLRTLAWIRSHRFRRIYDLQSNDRSGILCALSGVAERIGNHPRFPYTHHPAAPYRGRGHIYDRMLEVLRSAGVAAVPEPPYLPVSTTGVERVRGWIADHALKRDRTVLFHAGASARHPQKCWPGFAALVAPLQCAGFTIVWAGGEEDRPLNLQLSRAGGIDATGLFSLPELAELGRHARLAVVNDSGPMHALSASGIPVYGLFGPTDWRRTHAIGQKQRVISLQPEDGPFVPMALSDISPAHVLERLRADALLD